VKSRILRVNSNAAIVFQVLEAQNIPRIDAAKALLKHAFIGMVPNQLIFSYFSHDVASKVCNRRLYVIKRTNSLPRREKKNSRDPLGLKRT